MRQKNKKKQDLTQTINDAIRAVSDHWKDKAGSDAAKINNRRKDQALTSSWESEIRNKADAFSINSERDRLIGLINAEKNKEGSIDNYNDILHIVMTTMKQAATVVILQEDFLVEVAKEVAAEVV